MSKSIPWGNEAVPRDIHCPEPSKGGYSAFSSGPMMDPTPKDINISSVFPIGDSGPIPTTDSNFQMSSEGPPYGQPSTDESNFAKLEHKLAHKKGVTNPAGLAAKIGREELGEKEMARRSAEGRKHREE